MSVGIPTGQGLVSAPLAGVAGVGSVAVQVQPLEQLRVLVGVPGSALVWVLVDGWARPLPGEWRWLAVRWGLSRSGLPRLGLLGSAVLRLVVAWRCCWPPEPAASSPPELWPPPVPAGMPGFAPCPSSCPPPAPPRGWHPGAPVGLAVTATSGWRAVRGCPGSAATARAGWCWAMAPGWTPSAVLVTP